MFYALIKGVGKGCDYCIDCNKTFRKLDATTRGEAIDEVAGIVKDGGFQHSECKVGKVKILQVTEAIDFDIDGFWKVYNEAKAKRIAEKKLAEDKATYEKLKKQFGE
jgi:hypothetical protein